MAKRIAKIHPEFNLRLNSRTDASLLFQALPDIFGPGSVSYTGRLRTFDLGVLGEAITVNGNLQAATMVINGLGAVTGARTGKG
jgi:hypothetical protein